MNLDFLRKTLFVISKVLHVCDKFFERLSKVSKFSTGVMCAIRGVAVN